jgi:hypothetical protein
MWSSASLPENPLSKNIFKKPGKKWVPDCHGFSFQNLTGSCGLVYFCLYFSSVKQLMKILEGALGTVN